MCLVYGWCDAPSIGFMMFVYAGFMLASCWCSFGFVLGFMFGVIVGFMLVSCWLHLGFFVGLCWVLCGAYVGFLLELCWLCVVFWGLFKNSFGGCVGIMLALCWGLFGVYYVSYVGFMFGVVPVLCLVL